jgi:1-aminocyclopropane-1-carboxylate deaminase
MLFSNKVKTETCLFKSEILDFFNLKESPQIAIKREDKIHPFVSGNKFRKLKYNLLEARNNKFESLLTFGGAYSNHIAATAAAGNEYGFKTIGIIRGEELIDKVVENPTLAFAKANQMQLHFITREQYKQRNSKEFISELKNKFGNFYLLPEGGTNDLAIKGCEEILTPEDNVFDVICVPVGTGGTLAGIINSTQPQQKVIGFSALKGDFLNEEVKKWTNKSNWEITDNYCFGGYAKVNEELIHFINQFKMETGIPLDPIYTAKMMYGIFQMTRDQKIQKNSRILAIHTGGLQGIAGMNINLKKSNLPLIVI